MEYFYEIPPYSLIRRVTMQMSSLTQITPGIWTLVFTPKDIVEGTIDNTYLQLRGYQKIQDF
ncbi:hypothetical protein Q5M85_03960 [Paraclostridium bifermentans]|nr:hypothetical protein [Paraclostridium bifermentans]